MLMKNTSKLVFKVLKKCYHYQLLYFTVQYLFILGHLNQDYQTFYAKKIVSLPVLTKCPVSHPHVFDGGKKCCQVVLKANDTSLAEDCDGTRIRVASHAACCLNDKFVDCPDKIRGCNRNFKKNGKSFFYSKLGLHSE